MKIFNRKYLIILFCSLILGLHFANGLHFVIIDHSSDNANKSIITHHCDDYIQQQIFIFDHEICDIEPPKWIDQTFKICKVYIVNYEFNLSFDINNKGPPNQNIILG